MPINNIQLATATFMAVNCPHKEYQVMEVPAGQGKSRIAAAIAFLILNRSQNVHVYIVYPNKGLKNSDKDES